MEVDMNLYDELLHDERRKDILEEINTFRLEREAVRGKTPYDKGLVLVGRWMILLGTELCQRHQNAVHDSLLDAASQSC